MTKYILIDNERSVIIDKICSVTIREYMKHLSCCPDHEIHYSYGVEISLVNNNSFLLSFDDKESATSKMREILDILNF